MEYLSADTPDVCCSSFLVRFPPFINVHVENVNSTSFHLISRPPFSVSNFFSTQLHQCISSANSTSIRKQICQMVCGVLLVWWLELCPTLAWIDVTVLQSEKIPFTLPVNTDPSVLVTKPSDALLALLRPLLLPMLKKIGRGKFLTVENAFPT